MYSQQKFSLSPEYLENPKPFFINLHFKIPKFKKMNIKVKVDIFNRRLGLKVFPRIIMKQINNTVSYLNLIF